MLAERGLDTPGVRGADALVDRESLPQVRRGLERVLAQEAAADSLQGAGLLERGTEVAGYGQCLVVEVSVSTSPMLLRALASPCREPSSRCHWRACRRVASAPG